MNELLIIVGITFLVCMFIGYKRGFIKIVASLATTAATFLLVMFLSPYVSDAVLNTFPIEKMMQEKCMEILVGGFEEGTEEIVSEKIENSREEQISLIENAQLPNVFRQLLLENNNTEVYEALGVTTFSEYVGGYLAKLVADIIGFLLTLLVVTIILRVILYMLGVIEKLPVVSGLNQFAGAVLGLGTGVIIVWVLFIVVTLLYDTELGKTCIANVTENEFLTYLYDNNILMNYITKFRG